MGSLSSEGACGGSIVKVPLSLAGDHVARSGYWLSVFGGWLRNVLPFRPAPKARQDDIHSDQHVVIDRETDDPMWVSRW
jgi:hypothetical protein